MRAISAISCLLMLAAGAALAQTSLPRFYVFQGIERHDQIRAQPPGFATDPMMIGMVAINVSSGEVDHDPVLVADKVMDFIRDRLRQPSLGYLNPADIAVSVTGFAHGLDENDPSHAIFTSMLDPSDPIVPRPGQTLTWPPGFSAPPDSTNWWKYMLIHPWMDATRPRLADWTRTFIARIISRHANDGIPLPRRWVFDTEQPLFSCCEWEWSHQLANVMKDARWDSHPVPGFIPPRTMAQLLNEASAEFGWNLALGDGTPLNPGFNATLGGPQEVANRPLAHWYMMIAHRARSALMAETAYEPIREAYRSYAGQHPGARVPEPIVSNFGEFNTDGQWDSAGWQEDKTIRLDSRTGAQRQEEITYDIQSRGLRRTAIDVNNEGARHGHTMLRAWFGSAYAQERWANFSTKTWSDRDSIPLYDCRVMPAPWYSHAQRDLYKPGWPMETPNQTVLRLNRRRLEAVLNSHTPGRMPATFPYILFPGQVGNFGIVADDDLTISMLAMLRAKNINEICPFTDAGPGSNRMNWVRLRSAARKAWAFQIAGAVWTIAAETSNTGGLVPDLSDTTRIVHQGEFIDATTNAVSSFDGTTSRTELEVAFKPLISVRTSALRINIECQVTPGTFSPFAAGLAEGEIWLWDYAAPHGGRWQRVHAGEGLFDPARYRFVTVDFSTRRSFDIPDAGRFVSHSGVVRVRLRHIAPAEFPDDGFESRYDLVQVIALNELGTHEVTIGPGVLGGCPNCVGIDPRGPEHDAPVPAGRIFAEPR